MNLIPSESELNQAFDTIKGVEIPKIPDAVVALQKELNKADPDMKIVGDILSSDPVLSGMTIKTVNSGRYGVSRKIESIPQATTLLGLQVINDVILLSALKNALGESSPFQTYIWQSSQAVASAAKAASSSIEGVSGEWAYLAGLFQNVGALVLDKKFEEYSMQFLESLSSPVSGVLKENQRYGTNHTVISFLLAKHWQLPEKVCSAIYRSHCKSFRDIDDAEISGLIALLKICENSAAQLYHAGMKMSTESSDALADSYLELALDTDAIKEIDYGIRELTKYI